MREHHRFFGIVIGSLATLIAVIAAAGPWRNGEDIETLWRALASQSGLAWFGSNFGSGLLFFVLDLIVVLAILPWLLNRKARRDLRVIVGVLAQNLLRLGEDARSAVSPAPRPGGPDGEIVAYTIYLIEEIQSAVALLGNSINLFGRFSNALYEIIPLLFRIRRRMLLLVSNVELLRDPPRLVLRALEEDCRLLSEILREYQAAIQTAARPARKLRYIPVREDSVQLAV